VKSVARKDVKEENIAAIVAATATRAIPPATRITDLSRRIGCQQQPGPFVEWSNTAREGVIKLCLLALFPCLAFAPDQLQRSASIPLIGPIRVETGEAPSPQENLMFGFFDADEKNLLTNKKFGIRLPHSIRSLYSMVRPFKG
jgi:hypothetical protein